MWPAIAGAVIGAGSSIFGARNAASDTMAANAAQMQYNRENMFHQNQFQMDQDVRARDYASGEVRAARDWEATQFGIERDFNAQQAALNREWQKDMSSTAYQRAVSDAKAAGLNPMLTVSQGGAHAGSGSNASASAPGTSSPSVSGVGGNSASGVSAPQFRNYLGEGVSTALSALTTIQGVEQLAEQTKATEASRYETYARTATQIAEIERIRSQAHLNSASKDNLDALTQSLQHAWAKGLTQSNQFAEANRIRNESAASQFKLGEAYESEQQAKLRSKYLELEGPARAGESQLHQLLNKGLIGGGTSAAAIQQLGAIILKSYLGGR